MNKLLVFIMAMAACLGIIAFIMVLIRPDKSCLKEKYDAPMITAVILNYDRPKNVEQQVEVLGNHPRISEIIIGHGKADTYKKFKHTSAKVHNIKDYANNKKYYCLRRHLLALKASNGIILMLDDDYIPSVDYIDAMYRQYHIDPDNFCGYYSRLCTKDGYKVSYPEKGQSVSKTANIILPGVSMIGKHVIRRVWNEILKSSYLNEVAVKNKGNGEDLLFNYYFRKLYNKKPILVTGNVKHLDNSNGYSTGEYNDGKQNHYKIRKSLCSMFNIPE